MVDGYGGLIVYFIVICLFIFFFVVILECIYVKGSGIDEMVELFQYDINLLVYVEVWQVMCECLQIIIRVKIVVFEECILVVLFLILKWELYDLIEFVNVCIKLELDDESEGEE